MNAELKRSYPWWTETGPNLVDPLAKPRLMDDCPINREDLDLSDFELAMVALDAAEMTPPPGTRWLRSQLTRYQR